MTEPKSNKRGFTMRKKTLNLIGDTILNINFEDLGNKKTLQKSISIYKSTNKNEICVYIYGETAILIPLEEKKWNKKNT